MKKLICLVILVIPFYLMPSITLAQRMWGDRGLTVMSPFASSRIFVRSNAGGEVTLVTTGNDLEGDQRVAVQRISPTGELLYSPEPQFLSLIGSKPKKSIDDHEGGFYVLNTKYNVASKQSEFYLQHYGSDFREIWKPGGINTGLNEWKYEYPKMVACKNGSLFLIMSSNWRSKSESIPSHAIVQIYDKHGKRKDRVQNSGLQFSEESKDVETCEAGDDGIWVIIKKSQRRSRLLYYNRIDSDGNMHFQSNKRLNTPDIKDFKHVKFVPTINGGLIVINPKFVQYVSEYGDQKWSIENTEFDSLLGSITKAVPDPLDEGCFLFLKNLQEDSDTINYSVAKFVVGDLAEIQWNRIASNFVRTPKGNWRTRFESWHHYGYGCTVGEYIYYASGDTLWKFDRDGNYLLGQAGVSIYDNKFAKKPAIIRITLLKDGNLLINNNSMKIDLNGKMLWENIPAKAFPIRIGMGMGLTQIDDNTLRYAKYRGQTISIQDITLEGVLRYPMNGRQIVDFSHYSTPRLNSTNLLSSGSQLVFLVKQSNDGSGIGSSKILFCDYDLTLKPDSPAYPGGSGDYEYPSIPFSDHNNGWWFYSHDYSDDEGGFIITHIDESGNRWDDGPLQIFKGIQADRSSKTWDLDTYDGDKGHWFVTYDSDKKFWAQRVFLDRTVQFKEGPIMLPLQFRSSTDKLVAGADGSIFIIHKIKGLEKNHFNIEIYKFDNNLELAWSEPVLAFEEPIIAVNKYDQGAQHQETAIGLSDGRLWLLLTLEHRPPDQRLNFFEIRLQLISAGGDRMLSDQGLVFPKSSGYILSGGKGKSAIISDNRDGLWIVWDDYDTNRAKVTYLSSELEFLSPYSTIEGIDLVNSDHSRLARIQPYLCQDNTLIVPLHRDNSSAMVMQRLTVDPR